MLDVKEGKVSSASFILAKRAIVIEKPIQEDYLCFFIQGRQLLLCVRVSIDFESEGIEVTKHQIHDKTLVFFINLYPVTLVGSNFFHCYHMSSSVDCKCTKLYVMGFLYCSNQGNTVE